MAAAALFKFFQLVGLPKQPLAAPVQTYNKISALHTLCGIAATSGWPDARSHP